MLNNRERQFKDTWSRLANTHDGQVFLKYLKEAYIDASIYSPDVHLTYYQMGKQDLVKSLIAELNDDDILDDIQLRE